MVFSVYAGSILISTLKVSKLYKIIIIIVLLYWPIKCFVLGLAGQPAPLNKCRRHPASLSGFTGVVHKGQSRSICFNFPAFFSFYTFPYVHTPSPYAHASTLFRPLDTQFTTCQHRALLPVMHVQGIFGETGIVPSTKLARKRVDVLGLFLILLAVLSRRSVCFW